MRHCCTRKPGRCRGLRKSSHSLAQEEEEGKEEKTTKTWQALIHWSYHSAKGLKGPCSVSSKLQEAKVFATQVLTIDPCFGQATTQHPPWPHSLGFDDTCNCTGTDLNLETAVQNIDRCRIGAGLEAAQIPKWTTHLGPHWYLAHAGSPADRALSSFFVPNSKCQALPFWAVSGSTNALACFAWRVDFACSNRSSWTDRLLLIVPVAT